jgi:hypothetical protein
VARSTSHSKGVPPSTHISRDDSGIKLQARITRHICAAATAMAGFLYPGGAATQGSKCTPLTLAGIDHTPHILGQPDPPQRGRTDSMQVRYWMDYAACLWCMSLLPPMMCLRVFQKQLGEWVCSEQLIVSCNMVCIQAEGSPAGALCALLPHPATPTQEHICAGAGASIPDTHTLADLPVAGLLCIANGSFVVAWDLASGEPCSAQVTAAEVARHQALHFIHFIAAHHKWRVCFSNAEQT